MKNKFLIAFIVGLCPHILWGQSNYADLLRLYQIPKTYQLEEIIIFSQTDSLSRSNVVEVEPTNSIEDHLAGLSGVDLVRRGAYASEPVIRGMAGERAPVTINHMKVFSACTDKMDPVSAYVDLNNLASAAVIKSASGETMNSTAGVLNLETKKPRFNIDKNWQGYASSGYKSNNELSFSLGADHSARTFAMKTGATYRKAMNYLAGDGKEIDHSQYSKVNFSMNGAYLFSESLRLSGEYIYDLAMDVGYPALPMDVSKAQANIYALTINKYTSAYDVELKVYGNNIEHVMDDSQREVIMRMDMPGWSNTYGSYIKWNSSIGSLNLITTLDYYFNQSKAEMTMYPNGERPMYMLTWPDVHKNSIATSVVLNREFENKDRINFSARLEYGNNAIKDPLGIQQLESLGIMGVEGNEAILPSVSMFYQRHIADWIAWNISSSLGLRQPSTSEGFGFYLFNNQDNYDYLGNPLLKPETSIKLESGVDLADNIWSIETQIFGYYILNYILGESNPSLSPMTIGADGVKNCLNIDYGYMAGVEATLGLQISSSLALKSKLQWVYGRDNENLPLPMVPPLKNTASITYAKQLFRAQVELISAARQDNPRLSYGEHETPAYGVINIGIGYKFDLQRTAFELSAGIENLMDAYYYDHLDFNGIPRPGRSMNLAIRWIFK